MSKEFYIQNVKRIFETGGESYLQIGQDEDNLDWVTLTQHEVDEVEGSEYKEVSRITFPKSYVETIIELLEDFN